MTMESTITGLAGAFPPLLHAPSALNARRLPVGPPPDPEAPTGPPPTFEKSELQRLREAGRVRPQIPLPLPEDPAGPTTARRTPDGADPTGRRRLDLTL